MSLILFTTIIVKKILVAGISVIAICTELTTIMAMETDKAEARQLVGTTRRRNNLFSFSWTISLRGGIMVPSRINHVGCSTAYCPLSHYGCCQGGKAYAYKMEYSKCSSSIQ